MSWGEIIWWHNWASVINIFAVTERSGLQSESEDLMNIIRSTRFGILGSCRVGVDDMA